MSPKSLLRLPEATSGLEDFTSGSFLPVIDETDPGIAPQDVTRLLFCSGKIYYELLAERTKIGVKNVAIARVEELYPYPVKEISGTIQRYAALKEVMWVQEEPRNHVVCILIEPRLRSQIPAGQDLQYSGRTPSPERLRLLEYTRKSSKTS